MARKKGPALSRPRASSFAISSETGTYRGVLKLLIDGRSITAAEGQTILDAARAAGIEIPTLCWYPTLPIFGNFRICFVSVEGQANMLPPLQTNTARGLMTKQSYTT